MDAARAPCSSEQDKLPNQFRVFYRKRFSTNVQDKIKSISGMVDIDQNQNQIQTTTSEQRSVFQSERRRQNFNSVKENKAIQFEENANQCPKPKLPSQNVQAANANPVDIGALEGTEENNLKKQYQKKKEKFIKKRKINKSKEKAPAYAGRDKQSLPQANQPPGNEQSKMPTIMNNPVFCELFKVRAHALTAHARTHRTHTNRRAYTTHRAHTHSSRTRHSSHTHSTSSTVIWWTGE